ncbi:hypothetical protein MIMGU_mgv1a0031591mg, partial [Erythranthe guttata]
MGLPEAADFARNFAVMVRVQGPDPKGLKMRNHAFHHYNSGKTMLSASGTIFPASNFCNLESSDTVLVLTAASVIEPFLLQQYRENPSKDKPRLVPGVQIDILMEDKSMMDGNMEALPWLSAELLKMVNIPQSSAAVQSLIEASCGSLENSWEVGWSLASHSRGPQNVLEGSRAQNFPKLQTSIPKRGDLLLAMGSPFGILSPLHFFNNISVGSVGNTYPPSSSTRSLLMADIRCLPGMEGSPVFSEHARFIGLLTRPLRQKVSGTEVQMVIPWEAVASACSDLLQDDLHSKKIDYNNGNLNTVGNMLSKDRILPQPVSPIEDAMNSICLITSDDGSWASG